MLNQANNRVVRFSLFAVATCCLGLLGSCGGGDSGKPAPKAKQYLAITVASSGSNQQQANGSYTANVLVKAAGSGDAPLPFATDKLVSDLNKAFQQKGITFGIANCNDTINTQSSDCTLNYTVATGPAVASGAIGKVISDMTIAATSPRAKHFSATVNSSNDHVVTTQSKLQDISAIPTVAIYNYTNHILANKTTGTNWGQNNTRFGNMAAVGIAVGGLAADNSYGLSMNILTHNSPTCVAVTTMDGSNPPAVPKYYSVTNNSTSIAIDSSTLTKLIFDSSMPQQQGHPLHLTLAFYTAPSGMSCKTAAQSSNQLSNQGILAIWMRAASTQPKSSCFIQPPSTINELDVSKHEGFCHLNKPYWTSSSTGSLNYLEYHGTLADAMKLGEDITINIPQGTVVTYPITSQYVRFPASTDAIDTEQCAAALNSSANEKPYTSGTFPPACANIFKNIPTIAGASGYKSGTDSSNPIFRSYTYSEPFSNKITVNGYGMIDGSGIIKKYANSNSYALGCSGSNGLWNLGSIAACQVNSSSSNLDSSYINYAIWRIDTSLLGLWSTSESGPFAIDVSGITVANTPVRNRGTVQLNVQQFGDGTNDIANSPVKLFDFKQVGSWLGASDGPDVGAPKSFMDFTYYQAADDTIKLEASNQTYQNATILQGGIGGIMLGMYGVTYDGVQGAQVKNVVVPWVWQNIANKDKFDVATNNTWPMQLGGVGGGGWAAYDYTHGLVSTRTCPRTPQNQASGLATGSASMSNAKVNNVYVTPMGNLNQLDVLVSLGVAADSQFCGLLFDYGTEATQPYLFGDFKISNIRYSGDTVPNISNPIVFYNANAPGNGEGSGDDQLIRQWSGMDPIGNTSPTITWSKNILNNIAGQPSPKPNKCLYNFTPAPSFITQESCPSQ